MSATTVTQRLDWVDTAKGVGIILVVYGHIARGLYNAGIYSNDAGYHLIDQVIYSFHMPLFFFLSGLFFVRSFDKRGSRLILNKIDTIFYVYILWSLIQGFIEVFLSKYTNGNVSLNDILILLWQPRGQFWFLYTLFFIFVFNVMAFSVFKKITHKAVCIWGIFAVSIILFVIRAWLPDIYLVHMIASSDVYFCAGIVFYYVVYDKIFTNKAAVTMCCVFVIMEYLTYVVGVLSPSDGYVEILLAGLGVFAVVMICQKIRGFSKRVLTFIGVFSLQIYLMHVILGSGVRVIMQKAFQLDDLGLHLFVGTFVGVLLPIVCVKVFHHMKLDFFFKPPVYLAVSDVGRIK